MSKLSCEMFVNVMKYMDDYPSTKTPSQLAQETIQMAIEYPKLRDELYVQLCKQVSPNLWFLSEMFRQDNSAF